MFAGDAGMGTQWSDLQSGFRKNPTASDAIPDRHDDFAHLMVPGVSHPWMVPWGPQSFTLFGRFFFGGNDSGLCPG